MIGVEGFQKFSVDS